MGYKIERSASSKEEELDKKIVINELMLKYLLPLLLKVLSISKSRKESHRFTIKI